MNLVKEVKFFTLEGKNIIGNSFFCQYQIMHSTEITWLLKQSYTWTWSFSNNSLHQFHSLSIKFWACFRLFQFFSGFKLNLSNEQDDYHANSQLSKISKICSQNEITKIWNNWFKRVSENTLAFRIFCDWWWWCWWSQHFATPYKCAKEKLHTSLNSEIIRIKKMNFILLLFVYSTGESAWSGFMNSIRDLLTG